MAAQWIRCALALLMISVSIAAFSLRQASATTAGTFSATSMVQETIQVWVCSDTNDAEEVVTTGNVILDGSDLELVVNEESQLVGLRFVNLAIPPASTIVSAVLQFSTDEPSDTPTTLRIHGEASDNVEPFRPEPFNLSSRAITAASVAWTPPAWLTAGESGPAQRSPNLAPVLQEIIDRPGWVQGNAVAFLISGTGQRVAEAHDSSASAAAALQVEFTVPQAVPVLPNTEGFGANTVAGRGGRIIQVTTLADDGPGSLREALSANGSRVVVFTVGGNIQLTRDLVIDNPFLTIAGQTAPSPGITLTQAGLTIQTHDVLVQHLRIRVGDLPNGPDPVNRDGIQFIGVPDGSLEVYNIVIDHCSISWAIDEGVSTFYPNVHDITIQHSIISENLSVSLHPEGEHSKGLLIGDHSRNISVIGNLFAHNTARNPLIKGGASALVVNNTIYNAGNEFITLVNDADCAPSTASIVGNVMLAGPSSVIEPVILIAPGVDVGTSVYLEDNQAPSQTADPWSVAEIAVPFNPRATAPPIWSTPLTVLPSREVAAVVLAQAGARPLDKDAVDQRIITDVSMGTGRIINSQDEVLGWPQLPTTSHTLDVPANPSGDDDGDGYTNAEEWLHILAAALEGRAPTQ